MKYANYAYTHFVRHVRGLRLLYTWFVRQIHVFVMISRHTWARTQFVTRMHSSWLMYTQFLMYIYVCVD